MSTEQKLRTGFDPDARELCPDGACVGVIGSNGRCAECGEASSSAAAGDRSAPKPPPATAADEAPDAGAQDPTTDPDDEGASGDDDPADISERQLCPDGACVGVIGSNGRCKECGTRAE